MKSLFVTGTDTGVGKTLVARAVVAYLRSSGLSVGVMKPCESGCEERDGRLFPSDAALLLEASGGSAILDEVCPCRFKSPMAPAEAAAVEGGRFDLDRVIEAFTSISRQNDAVVVEGAGGILVPFTDTLTTADVASAMGLPLLVVARAGLGTINHTALTVEAARVRGLSVAGVVFNRNEDPSTHPPGPDEGRNPEAVRKLCNVPVLGSVPYLPGADPGLAAPFLDLSSL